MEKIFIDGNSIGYKHQNGAKLKAGDFETQAVFGFLRSMRNLRISNHGGSEAILWDGHAQWRYDLYERYKADRDKDPKQALMRVNFRKARPLIQKSFEYLGVKQYISPTHEADDLAGFFVYHKEKFAKGIPILLVSGDEDWIQLVQDGVSWYDELKDLRISSSNLYQHTGYETGRAFMEGKCLYGDTSDKVNGVGGIGEKGAPLFLAQFKSVENFFNKVDSGEYKPLKKAEVNFADINGEGRQIYYRNNKLMNLIDKPTIPDIQPIEPNFDKEKFRMICERLNFASILANFDNFVKPFEESSKL